LLLQSKYEASTDKVPASTAKLLPSLTDTVSVDKSGQAGWINVVVICGTIIIGLIIIYKIIKVCRGQKGQPLCVTTYTAVDSPNSVLGPNSSCHSKTNHFLKNDKVTPTATRFIRISIPSSVGVSLITWSYFSTNYLFVI
jgi:hypothetical protein